MARNKLSDLRDHLFETLEALKDDDKPMEIARAKAIADVAQVIINTAKVEINFMEASGEIVASGFIDAPKLETSSPPRPVALPGKASA